MGAWRRHRGAQPLALGCAAGPRGPILCTQPWLPSLLHLPGAALRNVLWYLHPGPEVAHLLAFLPAMWPARCWAGWWPGCSSACARRHGARHRVAGFAAILLAVGQHRLGLCRYPFSEIAQIACFTGFFLELSQLLQHLDRRTALATGLWAGLLLNTKYIYALAFPGALLLVVLVHRKDLRSLGQALGKRGPGVLARTAHGLALQLPSLRLGHQHGLLQAGRCDVENVLVSAWGFLFSPGKSIFLYSPPLLLAVLGLPGFWRSHRGACWPCWPLFVPVLLFYCRSPSWPGDFAWGPRYAVFAVPVLLLPAIAFLSGARRPGRSAGGRAAGGRPLRTTSGQCLLLGPFHSHRAGRAQPLARSAPIAAPP